MAIRWRLTCLAASAVFATTAAAQSVVAASPAGSDARPIQLAQAAGAPKAKAAAPAAPSGGGDEGLRARVDQLEEQLIDLQVALGTIESLARTPAAGAPGGFRTPPSAVAGDPARVESVEVQLRALLAQVERMADRIAVLEGGAPAAPSSPVAVAPVPPVVGANRPPAVPAPPAARAPQVIGGFGETVVTPGGVAAGDAIGSLLKEGDASPAGRQAALAPTTTGNPRQMYEAAYGYLLQQDYGAAEAAFTDFLGKFPNDNLSGNAQYWLGETYFVRGDYRGAASAFLKGYQTYARSSKAPDSLLKLAMSLDRLGQKDAACSSFNELSTRFPQAPSAVKTRAQSERQRLGC